MAVRQELISFASTSGNLENVRFDELAQKEKEMVKRLQYESTTYLPTPPSILIPAIFLMTVVEYAFWPMILLAPFFPLLRPFIKFYFSVFLGQFGMTIYQRIRYSNIAYDMLKISPNNVWSPTYKKLLQELQENSNNPFAYNIIASTYINGTSKDTDWEPQVCRNFLLAYLGVGLLYAGSFALNKWISANTHVPLLPTVGALGAKGMNITVPAITPATLKM